MTKADKLALEAFRKAVRARFKKNPNESLECFELLTTRLHDGSIEVFAEDIHALAQMVTDGKPWQ